MKFAFLYIWLMMLSKNGSPTKMYALYKLSLWFCPLFLRKFQHRFIYKFLNLWIWVREFCSFSSPRFFWKCLLINIYVFSMFVPTLMFFNLFFFSEYVWYRVYFVLIVTFLKSVSGKRCNETFTKFPRCVPWNPKASPKAL